MHCPLQLGPILVFWIASLVDFIRKLSLLPTCWHSKDYLFHIFCNILVTWSIIPLNLFITSWRQKFPCHFRRFRLFKLRFWPYLVYIFFLLFNCLDSDFRLLFLSWFVKRFYWRSNIRLEGTLTKLLYFILHLFSLVFLLLLLMVQDEQIFDCDLSIFEVQIDFLILKKLS